MASFEQDVVLARLVNEYIQPFLRVYTRIRPLLPDRGIAPTDELGIQPPPTEKGKAAQQDAGVADYPTGVTVAHRSKQSVFPCHRVFRGPAQLPPFRAVEESLDEVLRGRSVSILLHGQTGSGKRYTCHGPCPFDMKPDNEQQQGLLRRSMQHVLERCQDMNNKVQGCKEQSSPTASTGCVQYTCQLRMLQCYLREMSDLLLNDAWKSSDPPLRVRVGPDRKPYVSGARLLTVTETAELQAAITQARKRSYIRAMSMGCRRSRNHHLYTMFVDVWRVKQPQQQQDAPGTSTGRQLLRRGALHVALLAGSERINKSGLHGSQLEEAKAVNSTFQCLGDVLDSLARRRKHVPYRNSLLTYVMQPALATNNVVHAFFHVAPEAEHLQESLHSLRFASKLYDAAVASTREVHTPTVSKKKKKKSKQKENPST